MKAFLSRLMQVVLVGVLPLACIVAANQRRWLEERLKRQASFDLECPEQQLTLTGLDEYNVPRNYGVTGCGLRARYVFMADSWVMNTIDGRPAEKK